MVKGIKTSKIGRKSRAKVVEWKSRQLARGTIYVPVEVDSSTTSQLAERVTTRIDAVNHEVVSHDTGPQSMDVDEEFWVDEEAPERRRVSSPSCAFLIPFHVALSPSAPTWKTLFLGSVPT
jgi:hypothetical protein